MTPAQPRRLSILVPVYNEECTIVEIVRRVGAVGLGPLEKELVLVDDASRDGSLAALQGIETARPPGIAAVKLVRHETNRGKGAAVRSAIGAATGEIAVIQDADLEYDPADLPALLAPLLDGRADA